MATSTGRESHILLSPRGALDVRPHRLFSTRLDLMELVRAGVLGVIRLDGSGENA